MQSQIFLQLVFFGRFFFLTANAYVQTHNDRSQKTALEGIPQEFRRVTRDRL